MYEKNYDKITDMMIVNAKLNKFVLGLIVKLERKVDKKYSFTLTLTKTN